MAGLDADEYALDELTCPITGEIFLDPVLCVGDGHTYERLAAERWLATHATSPLTGQPLEQPEGLMLVENHSVRKQAAALVQRRPELRPTAPPAPHLDPSAGASAPPVRDLIDLADSGDVTKKKGTELHQKRPAPRADDSGTSEAGIKNTSKDATRKAPPLDCGSGNPFDPPFVSSLVVKTLVSSREAPGTPKIAGGGPRAFATRPSRRAPRWEHGDGGSGCGFLAASASGDVVACASANSSVVTAWRPGVGTPRAPRPAAAKVKADDWVLCGAAAPRGDWVCAAGRGKFLRLWRVSDDRSNGSALAFSSTESERFETVPIGDAPWHKDFTTCVAALGETDAAYGAQDWSARLVCFGRGKTSAGAGSGSDQSSLIGRLSASPTAIAASAELLSAQSLVVVGAEDGSVRVFDTRAGSKPVADLVDHADRAVSDGDAERQTRALCLGRDARFLLHGSLQGGWVREGPRGSWRVRHALRRGLTAAALVPEAEAWANVAMVSMDGFGVAALDCETGALDDEANRVASEPCSNLCAFASVDAVVSHAAETVEGNARRRGWFARVFG